MMEFLLIYGFCVLGWIFPELCIALGGGKRGFPAFVNFLCGSAFGSIATYFVFS